MPRRARRLPEPAVASRSWGCAEGARSLPTRASWCSRACSRSICAATRCDLKAGPGDAFASESSDLSLPPMGLRLRLKASFDLAGYHGQALVILRALKRYG